MTASLFELDAEQISKFPSTRYMGSKGKLLPHIWAASQSVEHSSVLDLFSGSGVVSYMFKAQGLQVVSNDYMQFSSTMARATVENSLTTLDGNDIDRLISATDVGDAFVSETFRGLYYSDSDNLFIDRIRTEIAKMVDAHKRSLAMAALMRGCLKKRARGIFTYVGQRYDDGRRDLSLGLREQFLEAVETLNAAVFSNGRNNRSVWGDALSVSPAEGALVYIDPPYYSPYSDNEYVRRYHFVEGLARSWDGLEIQQHTKTKKFKNYPTPFSTRKGTYKAFDQLFEAHRNSPLIVSYSSNSLPSFDEMIALLRQYKTQVEVLPIDHRYSFGTQMSAGVSGRNEVKEYLFIAD